MTTKEIIDSMPLTIEPEKDDEIVRKIFEIFHDKQISLRQAIYLLELAKKQIDIHLKLKSITDFRY